MTDLNKIYLFRMIHIENIPHIVQHGITHHLSVNRNPHYKSIGDDSLINHRNSFILPNGNAIGDYVPFYFGYGMPMLYVIWKGYNGVSVTKQEYIVYLVSSVKKTIDLQIDFVFTDGHAIDGYTTLYEKKDVEKIMTLLDYSAINAKYWIDENDLDKKRRKEAEFLAASDIPYSAVLGYIVYNTQAQQQLEQLNTDRTIIVKPDYYF